MPTEKTYYFDNTGIIMVPNYVYPLIKVRQHSFSEYFILNKLLLNIYNLCLYKRELIICLHQIPNR